MHGERDELVRRVFNELNTRLRDRWVEVVPVDLRWGASAPWQRAVDNFQKERMKALLSSAI